MLAKLVQAGETKELSLGNNRGARHCQRDKKLATLTLNYPLHIFRSAFHTLLAHDGRPALLLGYRFSCSQRTLTSVRSVSILAFFFFFFFFLCVNFHDNRSSLCHRSIHKCGWLTVLFTPDAGVQMPKWPVCCMHIIIYSYVRRKNVARLKSHRVSGKPLSEGRKKRKQR